MGARGAGGIKSNRREGEGQRGSSGDDELSTSLSRWSFGWRKERIDVVLGRITL